MRQEFAYSRCPSCQQVLPACHLESDSSLSIPGHFISVHASLPSLCLGKEAEEMLQLPDPTVVNESKNMSW